MGGGGGGGVQSYHFGKKIFRARSWRGGQDTSQHFEGSFGVHTCNTAHVRTRQKKPKSELKDNRA